MKKHKAGFAPTNFKLVGKILLITGIILLFLYGIGLVGLFEVAENILYIGIVAIFVSLYIKIFVPEEEI